MNGERVAGLELRPAEVFADRYQILERLGEGASSIVYKARDLRDDRIYALKTVRPAALGDPAVAQGFLRELQIGQLIESNYVVRLLEVGESAGQVYLAMEYVGGRTLAEVLALSGRFSAAEFLEAARQICEALKTLHAAGIVHRDVKPTNLMYGRDGALKLMDLGIARPEGADLTSMGAARGTLEYMAPELLMGQRATFLSDIFAAGVVFYELLTGGKPFAGMSPMQRATVAPPSVAALRTDLPNEISLTVERCLRAASEDRPQSAEELGQLLQQAKAPEPKAAPPPAPLPKPPVRCLANWIEARPRPYNEVLGLMQLVLRKLAQIVERGQVHEPVTPTTIRLNQRGEPEIGSRASTASGDTWIISTPRYSAPELLSSRGSLEPAQQAKATLYAVGMVFYEILVGSENYRRLVRDVLDKNTDLAWLAWQTDSNLRLPRLDTVLPGVPAELANLFEQLLEKDPARRMRGFGEAEAQVNRLLQRTLPTEQFEAPAKVEAQAVKASVPSARRNELAIIAATAIALIALVFLIRLALR